MTHVSLTRVEAEERADQLTVESMIIELDLTDPEAETFGSRDGDHLPEPRATSRSSSSAAGS